MWWNTVCLIDGSLRNFTGCSSFPRYDLICVAALYLLTVQPAAIDFNTPREAST